MNTYETFNKLLEEIRANYVDALTQASLADIASNLVPVGEMGDLIRGERKKQGLTQRELCNLSEITLATLSKLENGSSSIRLETLEKTLAALGMKLWIG